MSSSYVLTSASEACDTALAAVTQAIVKERMGREGKAIVRDRLLLMQLAFERQSVKAKKREEARNKNVRRRRRRR